MSKLSFYCRYLPADASDYLIQIRLTNGAIAVYVGGSLHEVLGLLTSSHIADGYSHVDNVHLAILIDVARRDCLRNLVCSVTVSVPTLGKANIAPSVR